MSEDDDLAFAMFLQEQFNDENNDLNRRKASHLPTSLVDEAWEMIDPVPDIRQLFLQFNDEYFDGLLGGVEVRWSPRMTLCAGLCCYEGRGGLCSIRLSEPLLKLRPRKDLVQTLLHEMIHALLFVTQNNKDHDGHGPEFHKHMYRINKQSGTNITVYHNFHDEVNSYRLHWWKCDGPCQKWPPFYGVVKRAMNRAPAPRDTWWDDHKRKCGGDFTKIKEPENYGKKKTKEKTKNNGAESSMKKGNTLGSGNPSLPTFFDKLKKDVQSQSKKSKEKKKDEKIKGESCEEQLENPAKKQKMESVMPFSGTGHVLGGSKSGQKSQFTRTKDLISMDKMNDLETCKEESSSSSQKTLKEKDNTKSNRKKTVNTSNQSNLSIIDAFKRSKESQSSSKLDAPEGSKSKPIVLCEDYPGITSSSSQSSCDVSCPVCLLVVPVTKINTHLDNCLKMT